MTKVCKVEDCDSERLFARGYCNKHYKRWYRNGDPLVIKCAPNGNRKAHPLYSTYTNIKTRCYSSSSSAYKDYGGRGITVCARWLGVDGFDNFVADMGERPENYSIDRINNDEGYSSENCRWATPYEQSLNRRPRKNTITGVPGVSLTRGRYQAVITRNGSKEHLGMFDDLYIATLNRRYAELTR